MATKVDSSSPVEPRRGQSTASSAVSASSPKVSMFGAKSGFVIPKNKLSGSLVPIFRGSSKADAGNNVKEESTKQVQRKTKWGADITQDAVVRKGRALAYQIRVEQITQQLKSGALEFADDQDSPSPKQDSSLQSATDHVGQKAKKFELLELEKREIIGEILCLNPSYKAPPDYKPLLKEGNVPIPVKAFPGYNFIGLLLGPESNTQKRLEEETGAKIRVYGTKTNAKEKREITQSDATEAQGAYEELYVNVSADTYEKVDAAVSLIELLVTPVSGNAVVATENSTSVAGDNMNIYHQSQKDSSGYGMTMVADVNQVVAQPVLVSAQSGQQQFQQQYSAPWFPIAPPNAPPRPATGFFPVSIPNNSVRFPPHGGPPYLQPTSFGSIPRTSSPLISRPQLPLQVMRQPPPNQATPPQNQAMPGQQPPPAYSIMPAVQPSSIPPVSFPASRSMHIGLMPASRPSAPMNPQPGSMARPLATTPASPGNSSGWSTAPTVPSPQRPNMTQMAPQPFNPHIRPQQASFPQPNMPNNFVRPLSVNFAPATFPSQPTVPASFTPVPPQIGPVSVPAAVSSSSGAPLQAPIPPLTSIPPNMPFSAPRPLPVASAPLASMLQTSVSQPAPSLNMSAPIAVQAMAPSQSVVPIMTRPPVPVPSVGPGLAQPQLQTPRPPAGTSSTSVSMASFSPIKPPAMSSIGTPLVLAPKPLRPSSGDFTFQPLRVQVPESPTTPKPSTPSLAQNISPVPLAAPQAPSFRPASQTLTPTVGAQSVPLPSSVNLQRPTQAPMLTSPTSTPFPTNSTTIQPSPRFPLPNSNIGPPASPATQMGPSRPTLATQMGPPSFSPAPRVPTLVSAVPARPPNFLQPHQNQLPPANRPGGLVIPNQHVGSNQLGSGAPSTSGGNQFYDPFSPTSISPAPPQQGGEHPKVRKQETDAEYEDLMASVGVK